MYYANKCSKMLYRGMYVRFLLGCKFYGSFLLVSLSMINTAYYVDYTSCVHTTLSATVTCNVHMPFLLESHEGLAVCLNK